MCMCVYSCVCLCMCVRESPGFSKLLIWFVRYPADRNEGKIARLWQESEVRETPYDDKK